MSTESIVGKKVFCKRNGATGVVTIKDGQTITIDINGEEKSYTHGTFNRWWTVIPEEQNEITQPIITERPETEEVIEEIETEEKQKRKIYPSGETGIGVQLRDKFVDLVKNLDIDEVTIFHNEQNHTDVIKFKGVNVFECSYASRRFNVLAHPESLSPINRKKVTKMHPKEWGWSLRAKFVFTELTQWPLMQSIISDGLFYRREVIERD